MGDESGRGYKALLKLRPARRLALASLPADFADWLDYTAIVALLVFTYDAGPWAMAFFAFALTTPYLLVGPALAVFVDHWPLKTVLVVTNLGRALATSLFILAPDPVTVLILVFLRGSVDSAFTPARQAAIQATTPENLLAEANGLHQAINQASKIAGPAFGGLLLAFVAPQMVFGLNAVLSVIAALILLATPVVRTVAAPEQPEPFRKRLVAGFDTFRAKPPLLQALVFAAVAFFAFFLHDTLLALLMDAFGMDASLFGLAVALSGAGGLVGGLIGGRLSLLRPLRVMVGAALAIGLVTVGIAWQAISGAGIPPLLFFAVMVVMGGGASFLMVPYRVLVQREVDPSRIARVFAAGESVITAVMVAAPFIGSFIASLYGVAAAFLAGGLVLLVLVAVTLVLQVRRR